ncbi:DUF2244 domain-containing protein [Cohaesibacter gelatinilyticus]|uniref:Uncharacterized membrane protein n=1 Tax=Cohaesibacter gelatinilyticus TaxID=372072 RepID=A0A285PDV6_9HYPH|nr:DUF2244 domain-containing protein [Cohaesibacter gelatinilyticus]SNZ19919.1 Uncharacterized membrane protein [Cohaesibacter gelatinilyticus]
MSETSKQPENEKIYFHAILHPHRSLGTKGFLILMIFVFVVLLGVSLYFWSLGAWPVIGFAGLDLLALYWAFRINYRDARTRERILLTRESLILTKMPVKGKEVSFQCNPYWARLITEEQDEEGMTRLCLISHGKSLEIGPFLNAPDRESLARALQAALLLVKQPPMPS